MNLFGDFKLQVKLFFIVVSFVFSTIKSSSSGGTWGFIKSAGAYFYRELLIFFKLEIYRFNRIRALGSEGGSVGQFGYSKKVKNSINGVEVEEMVKVSMGFTVKIPIYYFVDLYIAVFSHIFVYIVIKFIFYFGSTFISFLIILPLSFLHISIFYHLLSIRNYPYLRLFSYYLAFLFLLFTRI